MNTRKEVLAWLSAHPSSVHGDPLDIVRTCEREVRRRAAADAWRSAREYMRNRKRVWEKRSGHSTGSGDRMASELCGLFADELRRTRPRVIMGSEVAFAGEAIRDALDAPAWNEMRPWIHDLAQAEEEATWKEIVRFTRRRARSLPWSDVQVDPGQHSPELDGGRATATIADQLMAQFEERARTSEL